MNFCYKLSAIFLGISFLLLGINAVSAEEHSWYIKKRGNDLPGFPSNAEMMSAFNAYYVDNDAFEKGEKVIYLTFDAGYENGNISKILDTLKEENVPAAFFLLDNIILKNTDLVKRMTKEGHTVCNHTKRHKNLCSATKEEIERDLSELETVYKNATGETMSKYFRFPEGKYSMESLKTISELGYKTIFWSFGYEDWDNSHQPDVKKSISKILSNTHNGEVLLLHPTSATNAEILPALIREWKKMGYRFGTLDELTEKK